MQSFCNPENHTEVQDLEDLEFQQSIVLIQV